MTHFRALAGGTVIVLALGLPGHAQQSTPQHATDTVHEGVTAVLVDVVVRDKRGQPVRDLTQADFQIFEEGVPQPIGSFNRVFEGAPAETPAAPAASASGTGVNSTAAPETNNTTVTALV